MGRSVRESRLAACVRSGDSEDLNTAWQLDQELRISIQMMDARRIATGETRHRLDAFPVGDRDELGLVCTILTQRLYAHRLFDQRLDADLVVVGLVFVGDLAPR